MITQKMLSSKIACRVIQTLSFIYDFDIGYIKIWHNAHGYWAYVAYISFSNIVVCGYLLDILTESLVYIEVGVGRMG